MDATAPLYTATQIRRIEAAAQSAEPDVRLMERAGRAAARLALALAQPNDRRVLILAGPGNNGGDAFEVAIHLRQAFHDVCVVFADDPLGLPADAAQAFDKWRAAGGTVIPSIPQGETWRLVIDGLFGIGLTRPPAAQYAAWIQQCNAQCAPVLALDLPSGLNADTGQAPGAVVRATHTITFIARKPGLYTLDGPDLCGEIVSDALALDVRALLTPQGGLIDERILATCRAPRPRNFHKGHAGTLGIVGGATGMIGAAVLAGRAALKLGAGRVHLALLSDEPIAYDFMQPELMIRNAGLFLAAGNFNALALGPGMGTSERADRLLGEALALEVPVVLDADALNLIAANRTHEHAIRARRTPTVITPHPAEAARLLGESVQSLQADRVRTAQTLACRFDTWTVLKGNGSIAAAPDGRWWINPTGNSGMAAAGMGDVLTGMIGSMLGQGASAERALLAGIYLHGAAGDACVAAGSGPKGLTASELIDAARSIVNRPVSDPR